MSDTKPRDVFIVHLKVDDRLHPIYSSLDRQKALDFIKALYQLQDFIADQIDPELPMPRASILTTFGEDTGEGYVKLEVIEREEVGA